MDRETETERGTNGETEARRDGGSRRQRCAETGRHTERNLDSLKPRVIERGGDGNRDVWRDTQRQRDRMRALSETSGACLTEKPRCQRLARGCKKWTIQGGRKIKEETLKVGDREGGTWGAGERDTAGICTTERRGLERREEGGQGEGEGCARAPGTGAQPEGSWAEGTRRDGGLGRASCPACAVPQSPSEWGECVCPGANCRAGGSRV